MASLKGFVEGVKGTVKEVFGQGMVAPNTKTEFPVRYRMDGKGSDPGEVKTAEATPAMPAAPAKGRSTVDELKKRKADLDAAANQ